MSQELICRDYYFDGASVPPAIASVTHGPWAAKKTGSCTVSQVSGGGMKLALDATSEVQNACLSFGDILSWDIKKLVAIEFWLAISASLNAAVSVFAGVGSARNDDPGAISQYAGFRAKGTNLLVAETDDNVRSIVDIATGITVSGATFKRLKIGFQEEATPVVRGNSLGGLASVEFLATDAGGRVRRVAQQQVFDMRSANSNVQPIVQIQKTTGTAVGDVTVKRIRAYLTDEI